MLLSIIIVNWNTKELLRKCIQSIMSNAPSFNYEIIVIDNASSDGSADMLKYELAKDQYLDRFDSVTNAHVIINEQNLGFAKANNQGIKRAKGEYILLLNPDTEIQHNCLQRTVNFMAQHQDIGILGCKLLNPDKTIQSSVRRFPTLSSQALILLKLHNLFPNQATLKKYYMSDFDYEKSQEVDQVMGAYFLINKKVIDKIGELDEKYWIWFEEVDYCKQAKKAGFKTYYYEDAETIHQKAQSFNQVLGIKKQVYLNNSLLHYFNKFHSIFSVLIILFLYPISLLLALIVDFVKLFIPVKKKKDL